MSRASLLIRRAVWLAAGVAVAAGGLVAAQPNPPAQTPDSPPSAPAAVEPPAAVTPPPTVTEEAPPAVVGAPAPTAPAPLNETEVAPAPPPKPAVEEKPAEPARRPRYDVAVLEALDKVTAESLRFEAPVGKPIRYKTLVFTVRACERSAPDEPVDDSIAYLEIESQPKPTPGIATPPPRQVFKGWMYASSPSLNPLEHPVYDAWVISCRQASPVTPPAAAAAPPRKPAAAPKPPVSPAAELTSSR